MSDAERLNYMKQKDAQERQQRSAVIQNKEQVEQDYENQMKNMIVKYETKHQQSISAYRQNLSKKVKMAKETNSRMDIVA